MKPLKLLALTGALIGIPAFWLAMTLASTPMEDGRGNSSFGRLFRFIAGHNAKGGKIPMTAPVLIDSSPNRRAMSFIMPESVVSEGVPSPSEDGVRLVRFEPRRIAALRFEGARTGENEKRAVEKLTRWLDARGLARKGEPVFAYYDPPWTPPFLRRNEVLAIL